MLGIWFAIAWSSGFGTLDVEALVAATTEGKLEHQEVHGLVFHSTSAKNPGVFAVLLFSTTGKGPKLIQLSSSLETSDERKPPKNAGKRAKRRWKMRKFETKQTNKTNQACGFSNFDPRAVFIAFFSKRLVSNLIEDAINSFFWRS